MLLESRVEGALVYIDAETAGGIDKGTLEVEFEPERILDNVASAIAVVARKLAEGAAQTSTVFPAPQEVEVTFAVRIDSQSVVSVSRTAEHGQFKVRLVWSSGR